MLERFDISTWKQDNFSPGDYILEGLHKQMWDADFGVFVFHPDDRVTIGGQTVQCVRDNVVFELGLFIGAFSKNRTFIVSPRPSPEIRQISDLEGLLRATYDPLQLAQNAKAALGSVCRDISRAVDALGPRDKLTGGSFALEYAQRLAQTNRNLTEPPIITHSIKFEKSYGPTRIMVAVDNILNEGTDVIVSSDDTSLTASGGVAKAVLNAGGLGLRRELERRRTDRYEAGEIAVTSGGDLGYRAVLHAITLDLNLKKWPNHETIRLLTHRCLTAADAIGARSISFPLLGAGTAGHQLSEAGSLGAILSVAKTFADTQSERRSKLENIHVCTFSEISDETLQQIVSDAAL